ncbi:TetR-like C-terminal domain-containing protein [Brachybacterium phenoliresistens]|uniref:TetR-like C-terminal domain-containing protein n=1 Tax=Brachybacterium phenoliresistens TaxID=396014 RepID=UPI0004B3D6D1|nr:TetR-like C-terminal domain-containing protein [Brachybacterium phenoliresistens]
MHTDAVTERTGGRSARIRAAALGALAELLDEQPADAITTSEVARRSEVNRTTLHRRWGGMPGLLADLAVEELNVHSPLPEDAGDLRTELRQWAERVITALNRHQAGRSPFVAALLRAVQDGHAPGELLQGRLDVLDQMLARAAERGEQVRLTAYDLVEIVLLPIYAARLLAPEPLAPELADRLVDRFLTLNASSPGT